MNTAVVVAALLASCSASAAVPDAVTIVHEGNGKGAPPCVACHGANGEGQAAGGFPRLAGLDAAYMVRQMDDFASGSRANAVMKPIASALSEEEREALARHYSGLAPSAASEPAAGDELDPLGESIALRGRWDRQVPACVACHGPRGVGVGTHFPPLAGQPSGYIAAQLHAWKDGQRRNDPMGMMQHVASELGDAEIQAVAGWFAAQAASLERLPDGATVDSTTARAGTADSPPPVARDARGGEPRAAAATFAPPPESDIPDDAFGAMIRKGRDIFMDTRQHAGAYVGNSLACVNCHLDAGRRADSGPLWAAWVRYPRYRAKNDEVNTFAERLQGCFQYSMDGKAPPADGEVIEALSTYSYWLATGAPTGVDLPGFGYPKQGFEPSQKPDYARGERVYRESCAICHGAEGQGQAVAGVQVFPPLWGARSFNWGAGMHELDNAAAFIKANMPLSLGGTLDDQQAWDVAMFMNSHERPQDPRFTGDIAQTRKRFHDTRWSLYGTEVNGRLLGRGTEAPGG